MIELPKHKMTADEFLAWAEELLPEAGKFELWDGEVLSPGTETRDHGVKVQGYFTLPSLCHYLIVDPERTLLIHHKRGAGNATGTEIVTGPRLHLDPPGLNVDLTEVLAG